MTNIGRIDLEVITKTTVFIFELKIDSSEEIALKQIKEKKYYEKYLETNKKIIIIGVNFSTTEKNISGWICKSIN